MEKEIKGFCTYCNEPIHFDDDYVRHYIGKSGEVLEHLSCYLEEKGVTE